MSSSTAFLRLLSTIMRQSVELAFGTPNMPALSSCPSKRGTLSSCTSLTMFNSRSRNASCGQSSTSTNMAGKESPEHTESLNNPDDVLKISDM
eukprot:3679994-Amphidinium_carterae.1